MRRKIHAYTLTSFFYRYLETSERNIVQKLNATKSCTDSSQLKPIPNMEPDWIASIDEMNGQYQRYLKEQEITHQKSGNAVELPEISKETRKQSGKYNNQKQHHHTRHNDNTALNVPNLRTDRLRSTSIYQISANLDSSIQSMNKKYEENMKECKISRKITFRKRTHSKHGSLYLKPHNHSVKKQAVEEKRKEIFAKKADKTMKYSRLCISIAITFFFLTMPANIPLIRYPFVCSPFDWYNDSYTSITNFLEALNYSCNFFVYYMANSIIRMATHNDIRRGMKGLTFMYNKIRSIFIIHPTS